MSLVGPRPFPDYHLKRFSPDSIALRRSVRPGITGLWQVMVRADGDVEEQQRLDGYYIRNWSIWMDAYILAKTVVVVLTRRGAY
jgi:lipopolysaccharide/colanic/teichoic acid biosynthesis glycosyltransferase